jgi:hypothetical protein
MNPAYHKPKFSKGNIVIPFRGPDKGQIFVVDGMLFNEKAGRWEYYHEEELRSKPHFKYGFSKDRWTHEEDLIAL